jgi:hypothetical protein
MGGNVPRWGPDVGETLPLSDSFGKGCLALKRGKVVTISIGRNAVEIRRGRGVGHQNVV